MKKIIAIMIAMILMSCQIIEKTIEQKIDDQLQIAVNQRIFPQEAKTRDAIDDFNNGIMYIDNAFQTDGIVHTLDVSHIVGSQQVLMVLKFSHISGCDNEYGMYYIKPYGMAVPYQMANPFLNGNDVILYVLTDEQGRFQWYSNYPWPYEKCVEMEITALWYSVGFTVVEGDSQ
jgi:hypothetical protein